MGFLDSMIGELVRRETGFNATRLVRRIGSKRLLMMGGAALAGGMLAQQSQAGKGMGSFLPGAKGSVGGGLPPEPAAGQSLPPLPGQVASPPTPNLPPLPVPVTPPSDVVPALPEEVDAGDSVSAEHSKELLYAIVRTMVAAALSDGALAMEEKQAIEKHLDQSGLTDSQQSQIRRDLVIPPAPGELAGMLPEDEDPEVLLEFAVLVLRADGELHERELQWLTNLAELLGVEETRRTELVEDLAGDLFPAS